MDLQARISSTPDAHDTDTGTGTRIDAGSGSREPTGGCPVVWDSGARCGRPPSAHSLCSLHSQRVLAGWPEAELGRPPNAKRRRTPKVPRPCPVLMADTGAPCGAAVSTKGMCKGHARRADAGWASDRLGESFRRARPDTGDSEHSEGGDDTLAELEAYCSRYARKPKTQLNHRWAVATFDAWRARSGLALTWPVDPAIVAAYLAAAAQPAHLDPGSGHDTPLAPGTLRAICAAIHAAHVDRALPSPVEDPAVRAVIDGIARSAESERAERPVPLRAAHLRAILSVSSATPSIEVLATQATLAVAVVTRRSVRDIARSEHIDLTDGCARLHVGDAPAVVLDAQPGAARALTRLREFLAALDDPARPYPFDGIGSHALTQQPTFILARIATIARKTRTDISALTVHDVLPDLDTATLERWLTFADPARIRWLRDRALMLHAWHLGLLHAEWAFTIGADLTRRDTGYVVTKRQARVVRADPRTLELTPARDAILCPVRALDDWLAIARPGGDDYVFCTLGGAGPNTGAALERRRASRMLRERARAAGLTIAFTNSSFREGFIAEALDAGAGDLEIARTLGIGDPERVALRRGDLR